MLNNIILGLVILTCIQKRRIFGLYLILIEIFKGIVHLSHLIYPQVVPNLYDFLLLNVKEYILKNVGNQTV